MIMRLARRYTWCSIVGPLLLLTSAPSWAQQNERFIFTKVDLALLEQAELLDKKYDKEGMVYHEEALDTYLNQIGRATLPAGLEPERVKWNFQVLRDPMPNAFAFPNGTIFVQTGLLSLLENEDQLASVLAHEITPVTDRHAYLHYRDYRKKMTVANIVSYISRFAPGGNAWGAAIQLGGALVPSIMSASINGYRRELERDADIYSFNKLIEGDYDPREMPNTFRLLERKDEVDVEKAYYNDHPTLEDRIKYVSDLVTSKSPSMIPPEVLVERKMKYQTLTENVTREDARLAILSHRPRTALARATKLVDLHPNAADNLYAKAEAYRALGPWTPRPTDKELSESGRNEARSANQKFTPDEEERQLLGKESGQASWKENQRVAEETYLEVLSIDLFHAKTYRGLGELFAKERKNKEAMTAYRKYLELQPNALDQRQIQHRIEDLERSAVQ
jgi:predicted Zn-dependent protease